ncbi:hypothetical protein BIW11_08103 [Tropilaelaps mercedesae]|uniref:C2H2-type domain-containing protein n=1 Tax=Tropilaelaps mercedesae TaxID=418985 RepID=A0A1V9XQZ9_9ACAR|nr:hypothetical protein BIW11_08103 [Tropilaelaps mercedesae]
MSCNGNNASYISLSLFPCSQCPARVYRSHAALNVHRRTIHGVLDYPSRSVPCQEPSCGKMMQTVAELRSHLIKDHGLQLKKIDSEFPNMKAFVRWKSQVESSECVCFIAKKSKNLPLERQHYYYCQRSWACRNNASAKSTPLAAVLIKTEKGTDGGLDSPPAKRKSNAKNTAKPSEGSAIGPTHQLLNDSNKGHVHCTAQLTVREDLRSGKVAVTGCLTHYAHSMTSRHFVEAIHRRSRAGRLKEGGVAGQDAVDISSVEDCLLAIYELAATKKKQKSVDKIQAALQDLFDCLKDYDEDDETLPGLEETRAWRQSAAQEQAERERTNGRQNGITSNLTASVSAGKGSPDDSSSHLGLTAVSTQHPVDGVQPTSASASVAQTAVPNGASDRSPLPVISLVDTAHSSSGVANVSSRERASSMETGGGHLWAFQGDGVVVTTIAHG